MQVQQMNTYLGKMLIILISATISCIVIQQVNAAETLSKEEARQIAIEAYIYTYPLVLTDITRKQVVNTVAAEPPHKSALNHFVHLREFPRVEFKQIVRPNFDALYSFAWLDLSEGPIIITVPETNGRYYILQLLDAWTDTFAALSPRTLGKKAGNFAIVPPDWEGDLPEDVEAIQSPTVYVWILGRTLTSGENDFETTRKIQDSYVLTPLSQWGQPAKKPTPVAVDTTVDLKTPPPQQVRNLSAAAYFKYAAELLKLHAPHDSDWSQIARLKRIGLESGQEDFDIDKLDPVLKQAFENAPEAAWKQITNKQNPYLGRLINGWQISTDTVGVYGNFYFKRAVIALIGLGANAPEDSIYPQAVTDAEGKPLLGENQYVLHFAKEELPPADAFWSVTLYDAQGYVVPNAVRFALGDRNELKYGPDGSLDIHLQHDSPGKDKESNWLPTPAKGEFNLNLRLYQPKPQALNGQWVPPAIKPAK